MARRKWIDTKLKPSMLPAWPSCAWLQLCFFPFPVGHPMSTGCTGKFKFVHAFSSSSVPCYVLNEIGEGNSPNSVGICRSLVMSEEGVDRFESQNRTTAVVPPTATAAIPIALSFHIITKTSHIAMSIVSQSAQNVTLSLDHRTHHSSLPPFRLLRNPG